jgi:hypothetical protein
VGKYVFRANFSTASLGNQIMKSVKIFILIMLLSGCSGNLIGKKVPPYPDNTFSQSGACITSHLGYERMCEYSVSILESDEHEHIAILAKRSLKKEKSDPNVWVVTDQLPYPEIQHGFLFAFGTCKINEEPNEAIISVVKDTDTEFQQSYGWSWQVNFESGKFQKIDASIVTCYNEGWEI